MEIIPADETDRQANFVIATLSSFIEHEEQESRSAAERLDEELRSQNLAVAGSAATLDALRWGEADTLVMANDYQPDPGWTCTVCKSTAPKPPRHQSARAVVENPCGR